MPAEVAPKIPVSPTSSSPVAEHRLPAPWPAGPVVATRRIGSRAAPVDGPTFALAIARAMGTVVVTAHGHLDADRGVLLEGVLVDLIEGQGNLEVVLDLRDVAAVDPSSVQVLVAAAAAAADRGGELTFAHASESVIATLAAAGLACVVEASGRLLRSLPAPPPDEGHLRQAMSQHPARPIDSHYTLHATGESSDAE